MAACHDDPVPLLPGAEPFSADGGDVAFLLCHGFTGSPQSLRPWAEHLAGEGFTVALPRLPGHGTSWQELNVTRWPDWVSTVDAEFRALRRSHRAVFVGGLSMGGALALRLAIDHGNDVAGVVLVNPMAKLEDKRLAAVPLMRHVVPSMPGIANDIKKPGGKELAYDRNPLHALHSMLGGCSDLVRDLRDVTQPVLLLRSATDHVVPASSSALVLARISATDVTEVVLGDSYHVATLDNDAPTIFQASVDFARRLAARTSDSAGTS
jgi:carboxylesterase